MFRLGLLIGAVLCVWLLSELRDVNIACIAGAIPAGIGFLLSVSSKAKGDRHMGRVSNDSYKRGYVEGEYPYPNYDTPYEQAGRSGDYSTQYTPPEVPQLQVRNHRPATMSYGEIRRAGKTLLARTLRNVERSNYDGPIEDLLKQHYNSGTSSKEFSDKELDNMKAIVDEAIRYHRDVIGRGRR